MTLAPAALTSRRAETDAPLIEPLGARWSPRAFDPAAEVDPEVVRTILEAARWAPSAGNTQPWRFIVARRGTDVFATVHDALSGWNTAWAGSAALLIVNLAEAVDPDGRPRRWARYDLGQAVAHLTVQAQHEGLHTHQMGGFDGERLRDAFGLDASLEVMSITAIGVLGDADALPEPLRERELAPRRRRPLDELVLVGDVSPRHDEGADAAPATSAPRLGSADQRRNPISGTTAQSLTAASALMMPAP